MYLEEIIGEIKLESDKFESKAVLNRSEVIGWLKSVAVFANASGGELYIGVEDKTNKLIGFSREAADKERNYFNNQVNKHILSIYMFYNTGKTEYAWIIGTMLLGIVSGSKNK